jgi:chemotaxis protein methyltransferase CheR
MAPASELQLEFLRKAITERFGFCINDSWSGQLDTRLATRAAATGRPGVADYLLWLLGPGRDDDEMLALVETLLIGETHFLRTEPHFAALTEKVLPAWRASRQPGQRLRIASLGCSSGEEPYSIALVLHECLSQNELADVEITGVDVNRKALAAARRGCYEDFQLRELTPARLARWFKPEGTRWLINPTLRSNVRFLQHNLLHPLPFAGMDVIFCRNVLIYFQPPSVAFCFGEFHAALRPGGYLFLGHAESAFAFPELFEPVQVRDGVIYQSNPFLSPLP